MTRSGPAREIPGSTTLEHSIGTLARVLAGAEFPAGERAMLRRMTPERQPPLAFLRLAYRNLPEDWEAWHDEWMTLATGIALMCPHPHHPHRPAGRVLAETGLSESRLERLLAADGEGLRAILLKIAYFLGAKQAPVNWTDFARLLFAQDKDEMEHIRLAIARDFYRAPETRHKKN